MGKSNFIKAMRPKKSGTSMENSLLFLTYGLFIVLFIRCTIALLMGRWELFG